MQSVAPAGALPDEGALLRKMYCDFDSLLQDWAGRLRGRIVALTKNGNTHFGRAGSFLSARRLGAAASLENDYLALEHDKFFAQMRKYVRPRVLVNELDRALSLGSPSAELQERLEKAKEKLLRDARPVDFSSSARKQSTGPWGSVLRRLDALGARAREISDKKTFVPSSPESDVITLFNGLSPSQAGAAVLRVLLGIKSAFKTSPIYRAMGRRERELELAPATAASIMNYCEAILEIIEHRHIMRKRFALSGVGGGAVDVIFRFSPSSAMGHERATAKLFRRIAASGGFVMSENVFHAFRLFGRPMSGSVRQLNDKREDFAIVLSDARKL
ncbi:MAG: hypothetical protein JSS82_03280 [Bacteroidetes bacterium]|nr:hypothetical protein [Bacteroidota bacterium]